MLFFINIRWQSKTAQVNTGLVSRVLSRAIGKKSLRVLAQTPENPVDCHVLSERGFLVLLFIYDLHIKQVLWDKSN